MLLIQRLFPETERLMDIGLRIGLGIVVGFLVQRLFFVLVGRVEKWVVLVGRRRASADQVRSSTVEHAMQRARTVGGIFRSVVTLVVAGSVIIYALGVMGWDVRPLLGGAAVMGVALGFGAQTLVRDVIAGIFILAEDQFGVGDLIEVNGVGATVEGLTVRSTTLRDFHGYLHFVPNGEMKTVINRSRGWTRLAVDVPVDAQESVDAALEICQRVVTGFNAAREWRERLLDDVQVWGVEGLAGSEILIRLVVRAQPGSGVHDAARELRRRLHAGLLEAGVRVGAPRELTMGAGARFRGAKAS